MLASRICIIGLILRLNVSIEIFICKVLCMNSERGGRDKFRRHVILNWVKIGEKGLSEEAGSTRLSP